MYRYIPVCRHKQNLNIDMWIYIYIIFQNSTMTGKWSNFPGVPATWSHSAALHLNDARMLSAVDGPEVQISWFKRNVFLIIIWCPPFFLYNFIFLRTWATNFECWIAADSLSWQIQTPELTSRYLWRFPTIATANLQIHRKWSVFPQLISCL